MSHSPDAPDHPIPETFSILRVLLFLNSAIKSLCAIFALGLSALTFLGALLNHGITAQRLLATSTAHVVIGVILAVTSFLTFTSAIKLTRPISLPLVTAAMTSAVADFVIAIFLLIAILSTRNPESIYSLVPVPAIVLLGVLYLLLTLAQLFCAFDFIHRYRPNSSRPRN